MPVDVAAPRQELQQGHIIIAPPDRHLVIVDNELRTSHGPRENGHRPAVDVLFRSAARACGPRVIAVVLSGFLDDGTAGAIAVRERGGLVFAQDPEEAVYPGMPQSAISHVDITEIATAAQLGVVVSRLCRTPATPTDEIVPDLVASNAELVDKYDTAMVADERLASRPGSAVPSVMEPCSRSRMAACCASAAVSGTPGLGTRCCWSRGKRWRTRYGWHCAPSRRRLH